MDIESLIKDSSFCPFLTLGLDPEDSASLTDQHIRSAYRKYALKCHPDRNPNDPNAAEKFNKIKLASQILLSKETREKYDQLQRAKEE